MGANGGLYGLERLNQLLLKREMNYDGIKCYTLNIDATGIVAEKHSAKMVYNGLKAICHLAPPIARENHPLNYPFYQKELYLNRDSVTLFH